MRSVWLWIGLHAALLAIILWSFTAMNDHILRNVIQGICLILLFLPLSKENTK